MFELVPGAKTIVHINQHIIRKNTKQGTTDPVLTCKHRGKTYYGHEAIIYDQEGREVARIVHRPHDPLSCGARVWVEALGHGRVEISEQLHGREHNQPACAECTE